MKSQLFDCRDSFLIKVFGFILFLNALKPWLDIYFSISYQLITGIQFLFLFCVVTFFNKFFYQKTNFFAFILTGYVLLRFLIETSFDLFNQDLFSIVSTSYFVIRTLLVVYILQVLLAYDRSLNFFLILRRIFIGYFILTLLYSILQTPYFFGFEYGDILGYNKAKDLLVLSTAGGNVVSVNHLGFFRSSGGIGGTAVDYANYLLAVSWVIFFTDYRRPYIKYILYILLFFGAFICFSRALFLTLFVMLSIYALTPKNYKDFIFSILCFSSILIFIGLNFDSIFNFWNELANNSDMKRIRSWFELFENVTWLQILIGVDLGGNSGIMMPGVYKLSSDGFVTSFIYDAGLIIFIVFIVVIIRPIHIMRSNLRVKASIIFSFFLMLGINSGFEKLFIVMTYILSISIVCGLNNNKDLVINYAP